MIRMRHTDEWIGLLVIAAVVVMSAAILQAGVLRDWFQPVSDLRVILPEAGVGGLEVGASVEVLGTKAGIVRRIVIDPRQQMYAMVELDDQAQSFIRRDSTAVIRRRFGVAGAAFIDISRGTGEEMDWSYAVINATTERAPTDSVSSLIDEVREKVFPVLDNVGRATQAMADIMERINRGEGNAGRLLVDQTLITEIEGTVASAHKSVDGLNDVLALFRNSAVDVNALTKSMGGPEGVPALLKRADALMASLQRSMQGLEQVSAHLPAIAENIDKGTTHLPKISRNVENSTANLPALLTQAQLTAQQLEELVTQLKGWWLLGGTSGGPPPVQRERLPASDLQP